MIDFQQIKSFYSSKEQKFPQFLLKEYLQYQILNIIFSSKYANKLSFLGGTAIRIIYYSNRFSEDLDFDNFGLDENDFESLSEIVKKELEKLGFIVELKNIYKGAYRCYIKIPKILKQLGFSNLEEQKILIQIDTVQQNYIYNSDRKILDKFDIYKIINVCPVDIILSKKIYALLDRKRIKGRDFFDIVFLYKFTNPNFDYLENKIGIRNSDELKIKLFDFCKNIDLEKYARDVKPFLMNPEEINRVLSFREFIDTI